MFLSRDTIGLARYWSTFGKQRFRRDVTVPYTAYKMAKNGTFHALLPVWHRAPRIYRKRNNPVFETMTNLTMALQ
uniref:Uncharacterized protein n=1 Tax=Candidatus Kentrum sp. FW TaxID=2126338 RepID=A0A450SWA0_9GAMM|nr:MAG: hypothetical protein BECKFW1821B_GA0114236_104013 [Candidatus Kentron sp. FW]